MCANCVNRFDVVVGTAAVGAYLFKEPVHDALISLGLAPEKHPLAKDMRAANARGEALGLSDEELAFYDALAVNDSAVQVLGEPTLKTLARELTESIRRNISIDWTLRENVRAQLRVRVKRLLRTYGYPPDKQEQAMQRVIEQAAVLSQAWAA